MIEGFEVVKKEFCPPVARPMMTVNNNGIIFNREAVDALNGTEFINVFLSIKGDELTIVQSEKWDGRRKADKQRFRPGKWKLWKNGKASFPAQGNIANIIRQKLGYKHGCRYCIPGERRIEMETNAIHFDLNCFMVYLHNENEDDTNQAR